MNNRNLKAIFSLALSAVLFVSVLVPASFAETAADTADTAQTETVRPGRSCRAEVAEPENAIGQNAAVAKALAEAGVTADQAGDVTVRVTKSPDGAVVYRVHFSVGGQRFSAEIDAVSGEVICQAGRSDGQGRDQDNNGKGYSGAGQRGDRGQSMTRPNGGQTRGQRGGLRYGSCVTDGAADTSANA